MKKILSLMGCVAGASLLFSQASLAVECETLTLGSAISLTGKYATNGVHAKNGYEFAIKKIAENGGVKLATSATTLTLSTMMMSRKVTAGPLWQNV